MFFQIVEKQNINGIVDKNKYLKNILSFPLEPVVSRGHKHSVYNFTGSLQDTRDHNSSQESSNSTNISNKLSVPGAAGHVSASADYDYQQGGTDTMKSARFVINTYICRLQGGDCA